MEDVRPLTRSDQGGLTTITLNRPHKLNALTPEMFSLLDAELAQIEGAGGSIGAVLVKGAGRCFSAGNDILRLGAGGDASDADTAPAVIERLESLPQPVVAAVHGFCLTGALEIALAADIIIASENAVFGDTHAEFGLTPKWGMSQRLPRRVGMAKAKEMMFGASRYSANDAVGMGLANMSFPDEDFDKGVAAFMDRLLANSWSAHRHNKCTLRDTEDMDLAQGLQWERNSHPGIDKDALDRLRRFRQL